MPVRPRRIARARAWSAEAGRSLVNQAAARALTRQCGPIPRVEPAVEEIGGEVQTDEDNADDQSRAEHGVHVSVEQRRREILAEAGPGEKPFR